jgi:AraC-like DNA-binding protein
MNHALAHPAGPHHNQTAYWPRTEHVSLTVLTELLDAALLMWDQDRIAAKSQIRVAAAMSRGALTDTKGGAPRLHTGGLAPWQAHKVAEFIDASLDSKIRLQDCAKQTRLSASHFSRAFKATFGTPVAYYIRRRRVERARRLMLLSSMPLSQVALATGFSDQAHYCRVFRDVMGISPNVWRRKHMTITPTERDIVCDMQEI